MDCLNDCNMPVRVEALKAENARLREALEEMLAATEPMTRAGKGHLGRAQAQSRAAIAFDARALTVLPEEAE